MQYRGKDIAEKARVEQENTEQEDTEQAKGETDSLMENYEKIQSWSKQFYDWIESMILYTTSKQESYHSLTENLVVIRDDFLKDCPYWAPEIRVYSMFQFFFRPVYDLVKAEGKKRQESGQEKDLVLKNYYDQGCQLFKEFQKQQS